jgi:hypothetical protein
LGRQASGLDGTLKRTVSTQQGGCALTPHAGQAWNAVRAEIQERIALQEALVRRTIVQGTPTQAAEDRLREFQRTLRGMAEQRQRMSAGETQRKMRGRRR